MDILERRYRDFIALILQGKHGQLDYDLNDILSILIDLIRIRYRFNAIEILSSLRDIENRIEPDSKDKFYKNFLSYFCKTDAWTDFEFSFRTEKIISSIFHTHRGPWSKESIEINPALLPRHYIYRAYHAKKVKSAFEIGEYIGNRLSLFIEGKERELIPPRNKKIFFISNTDSTSDLEDLIDRRLANVVESQEDIEESLLEFLLHQLESLSQAQGKLISHMEAFRDDLRELEAWAHDFEKNMGENNGLGAGNS